MNRTLSVAALALVASCGVAWLVGGASGLGVLAGALGGASVAGLGAAWQLHTVRTRPSRVLWASVEGFLLQLGAVLAAALVFRFVEAAAARVDSRSFLVAFATAVLVVMFVGALDSARALRELASVRAEAVGRGGAL